MTISGKDSAVSVEALRRRINVAMGHEEGDLLLTGTRVVNVFTGRVEPADIVIADGWIAAVGPYDWRAAQTVDLSGQFVIPGLIDSHMHLESTLLTPAELARLIVPHGTTATISDSHEIGNVLGVPGIERLIEASEGLPFDLFFTASSCVPATAFEDAGANLGPDEVRNLLRRPRVLALAEMMDVPALLAGDTVVLEKLQAALAAGREIDGHTPGMFGRDLMACVAAGVRSDHESGTVEEARAKASLGMLVQVREGSIAHNLDTILPLLRDGDLGDCWAPITDDVLPDDLRNHGHIDGLLRRIVAGGVDPAVAVRHASLVPARHYGLRDRGAVAPGYRADLVCVADLTDFRPACVFKDGRLVARDGEFVADLTPRSIRAESTVHVAPLTESHFRLPLRSETPPVIRLVPGQLITKKESRTVRRTDGRWVWDRECDVLLLATIERHRATGKVGLGLVGGFGLGADGALGSSVGHDSHNLIVAGTNPRDMLACVRWMEQTGGGFVVASGGEVRVGLPLPVAGLLSLESAETVCRQLHEVRSAAHRLGCPLACPFGLLSFLALPVIPEVRVTARGFFDVNAQQFVQL